MYKFKNFRCSPKSDFLRNKSKKLPSMQYYLLCLSGLKLHTVYNVNNNCKDRNIVKIDQIMLDIFCCNKQKNSLLCFQKLKKIYRMQAFLHKFRLCDERLYLMRVTYDSIV